MKSSHGKISAVIGCLIGSLSLARAETPPTVFAAASLTTAIEEVARKNRIKTRFSFASSGALARQIAAGAPADIFISANLKWADWIQENTPDSVVENKIFLTNRLAVISAEPTHQSVENLFNNDRDFFVAIGDPTHTPAGIYTKQSLEHLDLWPVLREKMAPAANIRAALYLVQSGATAYGIVYKSDALQNKNTHLVAVLPENSHDPILYKALLLQREGNVNPQAKSFFDSLDHKKMMPVWIKYGFQPLAN